MSSEVTIVSRDDWGAKLPKQKEILKNRAQRVVIHHTDTSSASNPAEGRNIVRSIQSDHMTNKKFDDIGYNFLIGGDGIVFEGRGWNVVGAHAKSNNHGSLGVAFLGNFSSSTPTDAAILSARQLLQYGASNGHIASDFTLLGHKDLNSTECPGNNLYSALAQIKGKN